MFIERNRGEQLRNARGRRLKKGACSRRIELCSSTSRVGCLNQRYCFLLVLSIVPRYPKTFLPSTEGYIGARNFSHHRNLQRRKVTCIGVRTVVNGLCVRELLRKYERWLSVTGTNGTCGECKTDHSPQK